MPKKAQAKAKKKDPTIRGPGRPAKLTAKSATTEQWEQLAATLNYAQMADYFGVSMSTLYEFMRRNPKYLDSYRRGTAKAINGVGWSLLQQAKAGNTTAQMFYLKTKGEWNETSKIKIEKPTVDDGVEWEKLDDEEALELRRLLDKASPEK